jgi:DNA-binding response OmpR family regulator
MTAPRILVVEDDPSVRGLLKTLLESEGYDVSVASDGLAGLVKAASQQPQLILLDVMMPDLGGLRVLEELRADPRLRAVPVLVVTGRQDAVPRLREQLGEDCVFLKPFVVTELLSRVGDIIGAGEEQP